MYVVVSRSHVWGKRGKEIVNLIPTNWSKKLTLLGAIARMAGWLHHDVENGEQGTVLRGRSTCDGTPLRGHYFIPSCHIRKA